MFGVNLPAPPPGALKLSRLLFNKQSGGEAYKRRESCSGSLFLFARQVSILLKDTAPTRSRHPGLESRVKTNYGGVKRRAQ